MEKAEKKVKPVKRRGARTKKTVELPAELSRELEALVRQSLENAVPEVLPVLPLNRFVLFPGMVAPLVVQTERSKKLVEALAAENQLFIAALQKDADQPDDRVGPDDLHQTGCVARVMKRLKFPDSSVHILVEGLSRCTLHEFKESPVYLQAHYSMARETAARSRDIKALARNASHRFQEVITMTPGIPDELKVAVFNVEDPGRLADLIVSNLNIAADKQQEVLEETKVRARLQRVTELLNKEYEVLKLGTKIQDRVSRTFTKNQREFFLREQLKAIRSELGEEDVHQSDLADIKKRLEGAGLSPEAQKAAAKELARLDTIPSVSPEYGLIRTYLDWLSELPWSVRSEDRMDLAAAGRVLDRDHYGLKKVKERILEYLAVLQLKKNLKGPILCLAGPPGVGKTSLGRSVARALGREFIRMSLGGMHDEAEVRGHRRTYIGAMPGRILQGLKRAGTRNPVFMLDEIDKVGADFRGDPADALLEVLDPEQNSTFRDNYLDVDFDLSEVLFITTANMLDTIPEPLQDRMEVIEVSGYTRLEKAQIASRHLIPKQLEAHGLPRGALVFQPEALMEIIEHYTSEAGVRNLERALAAVCRKTARQYAEGNRRPVRLTPRKVRTLLGPVRFEQDVAEGKTRPGVVTGLAWTPHGGEILFVEAARMPGEGNLILTGSLGEVMKESARAALTWLRSHGSRFELKDDPEAREDVHIHVPAGAIPKDGPSAGFAMVLALVSLYTRRPVRADLAMTGEITLRGRITPVGGVKEKVLAAARAGIRHLMLPEKNRRDMEEIPPEIRKRLTFKFIRTIDEGLRYAFDLSGAEPTGRKRSRKPSKVL